MQLLSIDCLGKELRLEGTLSGWQALFWDNQLVSEKNASADPDPMSNHSFSLQNGETEILCELNCQLDWQPFGLEYELKINQEMVSSNRVQQSDIEKRIPEERQGPKEKVSAFGLMSLAFKLFKSVKVIKALLVAGSLAAYSWLFSLPFALGLILCLVVHEYGHIRAMKYFGMKTKGIYLIPFVGGLALSENKINTRWQEVVIAIMGPFFGLILSLASLVIYWLTGIEMFAGLAVYNALLNLFNLLPILPLDGGHIMKSITFSMHSVVGLVLCILGAALGVLTSYYFGLALLALMLAIGSSEIMMEWKMRKHNQLLPLDRYGQIFSIVWYLGTMIALASIIYVLGQGDNEALSLPMKILGS
ncbi:site-2 protease family protein [Marinomonas sp. PE14-40]|uniref:site-2 protease family protein n=1 Tax=Marinomonas sp. PE14-40 TaxID=3060621 RepID=UPI003F670628